MKSIDIMNIYNCTLDSKIGIITYDAAHLKTEQIIHNLIRKGYKNLTIFALPFKSRPKRTILFPHRPNQTESIPTESLAYAHDIKFIRFDGNNGLLNCDFYLITGAGILSPELIANKKIINAHPGIIPSSRGLDSFKWSIYNGTDLGVTLHFIDEDVDVGEIITIVKTPVYKFDSLISLARRHYEAELDILSNFSFHLENRVTASYPINESRKRMPFSIEESMVRYFDEYKEKYAK